MLLEFNYCLPAILLRRDKEVAEAKKNKVTEVERFDGFLAEKTHIQRGSIRFVCLSEPNNIRKLIKVAPKLLGINLQEPTRDFVDDKPDEHHSGRKISYIVASHPGTMLQLCYPKPDSKSPHRAYLIKARPDDYPTLEKNMVRFEGRVG